MSNPLFWHRLQFAFTITYHYLFPVLTMRLALLIVVMKALGLRRDGEGWNQAAHFWIRIFGLNFALGVATGIPMEFQFGTNWARFSRYAGASRPWPPPTAICAFPMMLRATGGATQSLTVYNSAVDPRGLRIALAWCVVGLLLACAYFVINFRLHRGKAVAAQEGEGY
jgi:cytochrome bd-type quinol oxidase subunit 1